MLLFANATSQRMMLLRLTSSSGLNQASDCLAMSLPVVVIDPKLFLASCQREYEAFVLNTSRSDRAKEVSCMGSTAILGGGGRKDGRVFVTKLWLYDATPEERQEKG
jgi:hypothetical protein